MFTFKGIDSTTHLRELKVGHSVLPPSDIKILEIENKHGAYFLGQRYGVRTITVDVAIIGASNTDLRTKVRAIADWLHSNKPETLSFSDEPDKTYKAILSDSTELEQIVSIGQGTLTFLCPSPFAEGAFRSVQHTGNQTVTINNNGTFKSFPRIIVEPTKLISSVKLTKANQDTSFVSDSQTLLLRGDYKSTEFIEVTTQMDIGDVLIIDCKNGKVELNGTTVMATMSIGSDFFALDSGDNQVTITDGVKVTFEHNERWL